MNIGIEFEANTKAALLKAMREAPYKTTKGLRDWVQRSAQRTRSYEAKEVPVRTGDLLNSVHTISYAGGLKAEVRPVKSYAYYVHEGTGIYASNGMGRKTPWYVKTSDGGFMTHGQKPNKFVERTYKKVKPEIERDATLTLKKIVSSI